MVKKKILIVDDERSLVDLLRLQLEEAGYGVVSAYDGQEALEKTRRIKPDLIILDLLLPKIDGYKVCRMLKFDTKYRDIPVILFTARGQDEDIRLGKDVGADAYITKPVAPKTLLERVVKLIGE